MIPHTLSTGDPSTLGSYHALAVAAFGEDSPAVAFLIKKIAQSPRGMDEVVVADESQMLQLLAGLHVSPPSVRAL